MVGPKNILTMILYQWRLYRDANQEIDNLVHCFIRKVSVFLQTENVLPRYRCESEMTKRNHSIHDKFHQIVIIAGVAEKHLDNYEEDYLTDLLGRY